MKHHHKGGLREGNGRVERSKSFADVVTNGKKVSSQRDPNQLLVYSNYEVRNMLSKTFVGEVVNPG